MQFEIGRHVQSEGQRPELYQALAAAGIVLIGENPPITAWWNNNQQIPAAKSVSLTAKGGPLIRDITMFPGNTRFYEIPTALSVEVLEVTGLQEDQPMKGLTIGEFTWRWVPTETGQALLRQGLTLRGVKAAGAAKAEQRGAAQFQLYDDGWRLGGIHF